MLLPSFDSSPQPFPPQLTLPARTQEPREGGLSWGATKEVGKARICLAAFGKLWQQDKALLLKVKMGKSWKNPPGRGALSQRQANPESEFTGRSSVGPSLTGILQGRKVFSLPRCCFQVTGRNVGAGTAPGKDSGLGESLDLSPPVPSPTLAPSASQS